MLAGQSSHSYQKRDLAWAMDTSKAILRKELVKCTATTKAPQTETEVFNEELLQDMTFDAQFEQVETNAPRPYSLLYVYAWPPERIQIDQRTLSL